MTIKEQILDCLADGSRYGEDEAQIQKHFEFLRIEISLEKLRKLILELIKEKLIFIGSVSPSSEFPYDNTNWYSLTEKGKAILQSLEVK